MSGESCRDGLAATHCRKPRKISKADSKATTQFWTTLINMFDVKKHMLELDPLIKNLGVFKLLDQFPSKSSIL